MTAVAHTGSRAGFTAPDSPADRHLALLPLQGRRVTLVCGDFAVEGRLDAVVPPDPGSDHPAPVVVIDTGRAHLRGPVLADDILLAGD
jgi:hypothetical protein